jgi:UDP-N-acetylmuramoylalanine--D-glutamate ligase
MNLSSQNFQNKKILIYGLGKTGISCLNFLNKNNLVYCYDDKKNINVKNLIRNYKKINNYIFDYIILSPGINIKSCKLKKYLKKNKKKIITDLDIFYRLYNKNKSIAITGTNGKSTASKLLYDILKEHKIDVRLCGNIGNPILEEKKITLKTIFVIEVSSYQLEYSKEFKTNHAVILNISPDHLERHGTIVKYVNAKIKIIKNQKKKDFAYINLDNKLLKKNLIKNIIKSKIINVKRKNIKINNSYFKNLGNQENLSFILEVSKKLNLNKKKIIKVINNFVGLKYRQEIVYNKNNILCINDSKSTSFSSSLNILNPLENTFWIVGGIPKTGDKFYLKKNNKIKAYIFGENISFFSKKFKNKIYFKTNKSLEDSLKNIIEDLKNVSGKKIILFSPAAASFDKFNNFEERGKYFNYLFKKYKIRIVNA